MKRLNHSRDQIRSGVHGSIRAAYVSGDPGRDVIDRELRQIMTAPLPPAQVLARSPRRDSRARVPRAGAAGPARGGDGWRLKILRERRWVLLAVTAVALSALLILTGRAHWAWEPALALLGRLWEFGRSSIGDFVDVT